MTSCPCCAHLLLRHIRHQQMYWFCRQCWQEMPVLVETPDTVSVALTLSASIRIIPFVQEHRSALTLNASLSQREGTPTRSNSSAAPLKKRVRKRSLLPTR